jgi:hypothetical protein
VIYAFSYTIVGTPSLGASPKAWAGPGTPATQTILSGGAAAPVLAFSFAAAAVGSSRPDQTFNTQTPSQNIIGGASAAPSILTRLKTKIFTSTTANITTGFSDLGRNTLLSGYIVVVPPVATEDSEPVALESVEEETGSNPFAQLAVAIMSMLSTIGSGISSLFSMVSGV